jgi:hypothetical protein
MAHEIMIVMIDVYELRRSWGRGHDLLHRWDRGYVSLLSLSVGPIS